MEFIGRKETSMWVGERQNRENNGGWVNMTKFYVMFFKSYIQETQYNVQRIYNNSSDTTTAKWQMEIRAI